MPTRSIRERVAAAITSPGPRAVTTATTLICAHRGASAQLPDNSLAAFEAAIAVGADMIEADVRRLADDTLVLSHDPAPAASTPVRLDDLVRLAVRTDRA